MAQYTEKVRAAVIKMLVELGIDVTYQRFTNDNIMLRCPFAHLPDSGHSSGEDSNPSFGIKITNNGFLYNCFTCDRKGRSLIQLGKQLVEEKVVVEYSDVYDIQNSVEIQLPEFYEKHVDNPRKVALTRLKSYNNKDQVFIDYNAGRGLDMADILVARLRYDKEAEQVIFPNFTEADRLVGTVRKSIVGAWPKFTNDFDTGSYLYLEWLIEGAKGIVVEGMYDALLVYHHLRRLDKLDEYSVVGTFGAKVTNLQIRKLIKHFDSIILMGDHDDAGCSMERSIYARAKSKLPHIYRLRYYGKDPGMIKDSGKFLWYMNHWLSPFNTVN